MNARLFWLIPFLIWSSGCSNIDTNTPNSITSEHLSSIPEQNATAPPTISAAEELYAGTALVISNIIGEIISKPEQYKNQVLEIIGYYRGWDLLQEVKGVPPVTRSDWVITDNSGSIYVTGIIPEGLDPSSRGDSTKVIRLVVTVENNQNGVYLKAQSVDLIP